MNLSGAAVARNAPNKDNAVKLIEFLLSPEAQKTYAEVNFEFPVLAGVPEAEWIRGWGTFTADSKPIVRAGEFQAQAVQLMNEVGWK